jgi:hypothetical protein
MLDSRERELRERLEHTSRLLSDMTDTARAMVAALTGTTNVDEQKRIFDSLGMKPSDYCRELRDCLKRLAHLGQQRSWPSLETINRAYRIIGEPEFDSTEPF